jgi:ATP-binding cassette subfamily B protein
MFQHPINYTATVAENIALGDLRAKPNLAQIQQAAHGAGADEFIDHLPQGYDTLLGRLFANGDDLSGGEWQRLALARAFLRQAPVMVLDEPTSYMDPWSEADWYDRFRTLAQNRTAILITHRFTIAMRADIIHVMHEGHIVESGGHDELLAAGGLYAQSWAAQMRASRSSDKAEDVLATITAPVCMPNDMPVSQSQPNGHLR